MFENSNVGSDHQQLLMQTLESVARRYGLVCLLHEKPFAGVNGSGKHNNWCWGRLPAPTCSTGRHAGGQHPLPVLLHGGDPGGKQTPGTAAGLGASIGQDHRLGANEAPPAIISIFSGPNSTRSSRRSPAARATRTRRPPSSTWGRRCCRHCRSTAATATAPRRSPSPATNSSSAHGVGNARLPEYGPEHNRGRGDRRAGREAGGEACRQPGCQRP